MNNSNDRFFTMAETYDNLSAILVPKYDFLQQEALNILNYDKDSNISIIDLGAGSGILIEKILNQYPKAKCFWVDFSEDFQKVAKQKLLKFGERVEFIISRLENPWEERIIGDVDAILSMSAIHHLEQSKKIQVYAKCYSKLKNLGWFLNIDEMKTIYNDAYYNSLIFWWKYFKNSSPMISEEKTAYFDQWKKHFKNWKTRNIDNYGFPKRKGDDIHNSFIRQLKWLREIGFSNVDIFIKYHLWSVIGGQKNIDLSSDK